MKEFVTSQITKKLKEKGYPLLKVRKQNGDPIIYDLPEEHPDWQNCDAYYIPTIYQILKWFRDKKNLHIEIVSTESGYCYIISKIPPLGTDIYGSGLYDDYYDIYEEAVLSGIEHVLDNNLI